VAAEGSGGIAVERGADTRRQGFERDILGVHLPVDVLEMVDHDLTPLNSAHL
jgi:hypothetical protein